ncbi:MAG: nuclear transport factor 2 family protein [Cyanobacteria bacterium J06628_3]
MTNTTTDSELIRQSVAQYFEATRSGDAYKWADRFADNAVFEDPVGTPLINNDPAKILEFGKKFMAGFETVGLHEEFIHVVGNEAAARWTGRAITKEAKKVRFEGINVFKFKDLRKNNVTASLRATALAEHVRQDIVISRNAGMIRTLRVNASLHYLPSGDAALTFRSQ